MLLVCVVVLVGFGAVGILAYGLRARDGGGSAGHSARSGASGSKASAPADTPIRVRGVPTESRPSSYPVRTEDDLERVCKGWRYPKSPKYAGKAPHPISVSRKDRPDIDVRTSATISRPYGTPKAVEAAWSPENAATVQVVACVDWVGPGRQVAMCRFQDPKPQKVPMKEGVYRVSLYEVATRQKLFEKKRVAGEGECPTFGIVGSDPALYSEVEERQLVEILGPYVERPVRR